MCDLYLMCYIMYNIYVYIQGNIYIYTHDVNMSQDTVHYGWRLLQWVHSFKPGVKCLFCRYGFISVPLGGWVPSGCMGQFLCLAGNILFETRLLHDGVGAYLNWYGCEYYIAYGGDSWWSEDTGNFLTPLVWVGNQERFDTSSPAMSVPTGRGL